MDEDRTGLSNDVFRALLQLLAGLCDELRVLINVGLELLEALRHIKHKVILEAKGSDGSGEYRDHEVRILYLNRNARNDHPVSNSNVLVVLI